MVEPETWAPEHPHQMGEERPGEWEIYLGFLRYQRNPDDDMYSINNVSEFFLGADNALYIVYAYGNQNHTSEMDIVIM